MTLEEIEADLKHVATKEDLAREIGSLRAEMITLRSDLQAEIATLRTEVITLRGNLQTEVLTQGSTLQAEIMTLRGDLHKELSSQLKWIIGLQLPVWLGIVGILLKH